MRFQLDQYKGLPACTSRILALMTDDEDERDLMLPKSEKAATGKVKAKASPGKGRPLCEFPEGALDLLKQLTEGKLSAWKNSGRVIPVSAIAAVSRDEIVPRFRLQLRCDCTSIR